MCIALQSAVFSRSRAKGSARLVLVNLAFHANKDAIAWPSRRTIALECGMSVRWAAGALAELIRLGEIEVVNHRPGGVTTYRITLAVEDDKNGETHEQEFTPPVKDSSPLPVNHTSPPPGTIVHTPREPCFTPPVNHSSHRTSIELPLEPPLKQEPPLLPSEVPPPKGGRAPDKPASRVPKKATPRSQIDPDWRPRPEDREFARQMGHDDASIDRMHGHFVDYHTAKGSLMKSWSAAFRTWVRNDASFGSRSPPSSRPSSNVRCMTTESINAAKKLAILQDYKDGKIEGSHSEIMARILSQKT